MPSLSDESTAEMQNKLTALALEPRALHNHHWVLHSLVVGQEGSRDWTCMRPDRHHFPMRLRCRVQPDSSNWVVDRSSLILLTQRPGFVAIRV